MWQTRASQSTRFDYTETAAEITDNFSFTTSAHEFKIGDEQVAATVPSTFSRPRGIPGDRHWRRSEIYVSFTQSLGNSAIRYDSLFAGPFVQDSWNRIPFARPARAHLGRVEVGLD